MNTVTLIIPVAEGKLNPSPAQQMTWDTFLRTREGKAVSVKLSVPTNTRSLAQNALHWKMLSIIGRETGNEPEDLHTIFKERLLPRRFVTLAGKEIELAKTTTQLSTAEFSEYMEKIRAFCGTELGISLPLE